MARYSRCVGLVGETRQSTLCAISRTRTNSDWTLPFLVLCCMADVSGCLPMLCSSLSRATRCSTLLLCALERGHTRLAVAARIHAGYARDTPGAVASTARAPATRPPVVDRP